MGRVHHRRIAVSSTGWNSKCEKLHVYVHQSREIGWCILSFFPPCIFFLMKPLTLVDPFEELVRCTSSDFPCVYRLQSFSVGNLKGSVFVLPPPPSSFLLLSITSLGQGTYQDRGLDLLRVAIPQPHRHSDIYVCLVCF